MAEDTPADTDNARAGAPAREWDWEYRFLVILARTDNVTASAQEVEVSTSTVYRRRKTNKAFREAWDAARTGALDDLAMVVYKAGLDGDWRAAAWYLSRRDPSRWGDH